MKKKFLKLIGTISAFFLSIFGLSGCRGDIQALYGVPQNIQQDLYGVPAPTKKIDKEDMEKTILDDLSENTDSLNNSSQN